MARSLSNSSSGFPDIEPVEWAGEKGGRKQQLLRLHRDEIVDFLNEHGVTATMVRYGCHWTRGMDWQAILSSGFTRIQMAICGLPQREV